MTASYTLPHQQGHPDFRHTGQENTAIERILECALALNWKDLTQAAEATSMEVEYRTGSGDSLEYLKVWSSAARGFWHPVCEYWMESSSAHEGGATFSDGYYSADLAWMLDAIMQHQEAFPLPSSDFLDGLVQISRPSETDLGSAKMDMTEALERIRSLPAHT